MVWAKQAAEGMTWLHGAGVIHRDFKPSNLLWDKNSNSVKVCDFGLSALAPKGEGLQGEAKGTPLYVAPELVQGEDTTHAADIYSFGIALSVFLTRKAPFQHHNDLTSFLEAVCYDDERPDLPVDPTECPASVRKLCVDCWGADPLTRPSFEEILKRFETVLVDSACFDKLGRRLWKKKFIHKTEGLREEVGWKEFCHAFAVYFGSDEINIKDEQDVYYKCLNELFVTRNKRGKRVVSLSHFGNMLGFFDPLEEKGKWVSKVCKLMENQWFWGATEGGNAHKALSTASDGAYLIRFSSTPSNYTISFRQGGQVWHTRIKHRYQGDTFILDTTAAKGKKFTCLHDVILSMTSMKDGLQMACANGPYSSIFDVNAAELGGYAKVESGYEYA